MIATHANTMITPLSPVLHACFLLLAILFLSTGLSPEYQDHFDQIELAENCQNDREAEEKEGKDDDNLNELFGNIFWHPDVVPPLAGGNFYFWAKCHIDIFTPPPEQV